MIFPFLLSVRRRRTMNHGRNKPSPRSTAPDTRGCYCLFIIIFISAVLHTYRRCAHAAAVALADHFILY